MGHVLIIGANGKVGRILAQKLKDSAEFTPIVGIRKAQQKEFFSGLGISSRLLDLEGSTSELLDAMQGIDTLVFTAGSGGKTGYDMTLSIDLDGAVKTMDAAKQAGISRYVMVSALHADEPDQWEASGIKPYYIAKHYADQILQRSGLNFTIIRPGRLLDEPGTGKVNLKHPESTKSVPREDVAALIVAVLSQDNTIGKTIGFNQGDIPIEQAIAGL